MIARKNELLVAWIGEALLARILAAGAIECGFVELYVDENTQLLADVLASPAGEFVRTLTIRGRRASVLRMISAIVAETRPWLARLAIVQTTSSAAVARPLVARALPRLTELDITGDSVFSRLELPQLRTLRVAGVDAIGWQGEPVLMPEVASIDLAFGSPGSQRVATHGALDRVLDVARFPALARLDLSRNEPGAWAPNNLGLAVDPFTWLAEREIRAQLVELAIPSVRTEEQAEALGGAIATMPALRRIAQARRYALRDARFAVPPQVERAIAWPRPWLPPDAVGQTAYSIAVRPGEQAHIAHGLPLAQWLDQHAAELPEHALAAWGHVFGFLDQLAGVEQPFPTVVLDTALASLGEASGLAPWLRMRVQLRRGTHPAAPSVGIRRLP